MPGIRSGRLTIVAEIEGFKGFEKRIKVDAARPTRVDVKLEVGELTETVTVFADNDSAAPEARDEAAQAAPSQNVFNLQRRVEGVLPVRVDVPRAGAAYRFVRPLVIDEVTTVSFDYRRR